MSDPDLVRINLRTSSIDHRAAGHGRAPASPHHNVPCGGHSATRQIRVVVDGRLRHTMSFLLVEVVIAESSVHQVVQPRRLSHRATWYLGLPDCVRNFTHTHQYAVDHSIGDKLFASAMETGDLSPRLARVRHNMRKCIGFTMTVFLGYFVLATPLTLLIPLPVPVFTHASQIKGTVF